MALTKTQGRKGTEFFSRVLRSFYRTYNPKLVSQVGKVLMKWKGQESELCRRCSLKYGEHPLDFWAIRSSPGSHVVGGGGGGGDRGHIVPPIPVPIEGRGGRWLQQSAVRTPPPRFSIVTPDGGNGKYRTDSRLVKSEPRYSSCHNSSRQEHQMEWSAYDPRIMIQRGERERAQIVNDGRFAEKRDGLDRRYQRLAVVLDMDETLIHTSDISDHYSPELHSEENLREQTPEAFIVRVNGETLLVRKRPGVDQFLRRASALFDLYLYTAGEEDYARAVLHRLDPSGDLFQQRHFRSSCVPNTLSGEFMKDLNVVPNVDMRRTVLVDNNPASFAMQPDNGILIESFYVSPTDKELRVLFDVLCHIDSNCEDVRVFLAPLRS